MQGTQDRAGAGTPAPRSKDVDLSGSDTSRVDDARAQDNEPRDHGAILAMKWISAVCAHPDVSSAHAEVAAFVATHLYRGKRSAWPSVKTIMAGTGLSNRTVIDARRRFADLGLALIDCKTCHKHVCTHRRPRTSPSCKQCGDDVCPTGPTHVWNVSPLLPREEVPGQAELPLDKHELDDTDDSGDADKHELDADKHELDADKHEDFSWELVRTGEERGGARTENLAPVDKSGTTKSGTSGATPQITEKKKPPRRKVSNTSTVVHGRDDLGSEDGIDDHRSRLVAVLAGEETTVENLERNAPVIRAVGLAIDEMMWRARSRTFGEVTVGKFWRRVTQISECYLDRCRVDQCEQHGQAAAIAHRGRREDWYQEMRARSRQRGIEDALGVEEAAVTEEYRRQRRELAAYMLDDHDDDDDFFPATDLLDDRDLSEVEAVTEVPR